MGKLGKVPFSPEPHSRVAQASRKYFQVYLRRISNTYECPCPEERERDIYCTSANKCVNSAEIFQIPSQIF